MSRMTIDTPLDVLIAVDARRVELGMSVAKFLEEHGIDRSSYYRWKKGRGAPSLGSVMRMVNALDGRFMISFPPPERPL